MTAVQIVDGLDFDPYDPEILRDPYPTFRRMREEAPVYYNPDLDFYALTRAEDVERGLRERETFISGRGVLLSMLRAGILPPPGTIIMEDPPTHTKHRALLSRMFSARAMAGLEDKIRQICCDLLDPLVGEKQFDMIQDFSIIVPSAVVCGLIGVPDEDQPRIREYIKEQHALGNDQRFAGTIFADYYDWRLEHPSDDILTHLMTTEFEDETGSMRTLTRQETLSYLSIVNGAGHDTTKIGLGWAAKLLAEHPDQQQMVVEDPSLIPAAFEEVLRYEAPAMMSCRYAVSDAEYHGQIIPEGSIVGLVTAAANRDERRFPEPDRFDIHRTGAHHFAFGFGTHYCLGQALARLEGRVALEEFVKRFPKWDVDLDNAEAKPVSEIRGYERLPIVVG